MSRNNKGQIRIFEAMIACALLIVGLSAAIYISNVYTVMEIGNIERVATNISNILDNTDLLERVVNNDTRWRSELRGLIENLLPTDTFYNLVFRSASTSEVFGEVSNLASWSPTSNVDSVSIERTVTMSLPFSEAVYLPLDVMLVMDVSGSMNDKLPGDAMTKISGTKQAAKLFIDNLDPSKDRVGIATFSTTATLKTPLTNDFTAAKSEIDKLSANGYTDIGDGIATATGEFGLHGRGNSTVWVTILLSDGMANRPTGVNATEYALDKAAEAADLGIRLYTIGLGAKTDIDEALLSQIVANGGKYYYAPSASDLADIYTRIVQDLVFDIKCDFVVIELTIMRPR